jgi:hypothetical protein
LDKILEQYKLAFTFLTGNKVIEPCSGGFTGSYGLPCAHSILSALKNDEPLDISSINDQWHLTYTQDDKIADEEPELSPKRLILSQINQTLLNTSPSVLPSLLEKIQEVIEKNPEVKNPIPIIKKRGRPTGAKNRRDKSLFEIVEDNLCGKKCRLCGEGGHNSRTCRNK